MSNIPATLPPSRETLVHILDNFFEPAKGWRDPNVLLDSDAAMAYFGRGENKALIKDIDERSKKCLPLLQAILAEKDALPMLKNTATDGETSLGLVILLDQVSRNVFRSPEEMKHIYLRADILSAALVREHILPLGYDSDPALGGSANVWTRIFFALPLGHSEVPAYQEESVAYRKVCIEEASDVRRPSAIRSLAMASHHRDVVVRFNRFPHRNKALGRTDTDEEAEFMRENEGDYISKAVKAVIAKYGPL